MRSKSARIVRGSFMNSPPRSSKASSAPAVRAAWGAALLRWYRRQRRDLPWRGSRDPYRIWVSEVMLQQTQVATVLPYYRSFLERFPDVASLAAAPLDDVLRAWSGLGYYRRARHLHAAAGVVVREHRGRIPDDPDAFGRLPGVGRYTRGAVLSIGFDRSLPVLDGNVARVLSRLEAIPAAFRDAAGAHRLWDRATMLVPMRGAGEWNQALMELGALVCAPRVPRCAACPVRRWCRARSLDRVAELPPVPARRSTERRRIAVALIERNGALLMVRRNGRQLAGLWEPPSVAVGVRGRPRDRLRGLLADLGVSTGGLSNTGITVRHAITHRRIAAEVWRAERAHIARGAVGARRTARWVNPERPQVALTGLARKVAARARAHR
jgi:A/G-specific adenine glycosylase